MRLPQHLIDQFGSRRGFVRHIWFQALWRLGAYRDYERLPQDMSRMVFVCSGNICRSALADQLARNQGLECASFGLDAKDGDPANERMQRIAVMLGVDLSAHRTTALASYQYRPGDVLFAMEPGQCRRLIQHFGNVPVCLLGLWSTGRRIYLHDPYSAPDAYILTSARLIQAAVTSIGRRQAQSRNAVYA